MSSRSISVALGATTVAALAVGFGLNLDGFDSNVLAELAGVALSVLIAYTLVEALLRRERRREWSAVSDATRAAIATRVQSLAFEYYLVETAPDAHVNASTPEQHAAALDLMAGRLTASSERLGRLDPDEFATTQELHDRVSEDLLFLREVLAPRVMQIGQEPELVGLLLAVEVAEREWHEAIRLIRDDWGLPNTVAWERAAATLEAVARLYRHVAIPSAR